MAHHRNNEHDEPGPDNPTRTTPPTRVTGAKQRSNATTRVNLAHKIPATQHVQRPCQPCFPPQPPARQHPLRLTCEIRSVTTHPKRHSGRNSRHAPLRLVRSARQLRWTPDRESVGAAGAVVVGGSGLRFEFRFEDRCGVELGAAGRVSNKNSRQALSDGMVSETMGTAGLSKQRSSRGESTPNTRRPPRLHEIVPGEQSSRIERARLI